MKRIFKLILKKRLFFKIASVIKKSECFQSKPYPGSGFGEEVFDYDPQQFNLLLCACTCKHTRISEKKSAFPIATCPSQMVPQSKASIAGPEQYNKKWSRLKEQAWHTFETQPDHKLQMNHLTSYSFCLYKVMHFSQINLYKLPTVKWVFGNCCL